jgi:glycosyltransferase involved in cell wall biosynthesis
MDSNLTDRIDAFARSAPLGGVTTSGRPLRLCFVSADYPTAANPAGGGMGAHAYALSQAIGRLGHDVVVVTEGGSDAAAYRDGAVRVHPLPQRAPRYWKLGRAVPMPWIRRSLDVWRSLVRLHHELAFDLVRFPDGYGEGFRYSFSPLVPYSVHLHGPASVLQQWDGRSVPPMRAYVESWVERRPALRASMLVAGTHWFAERLASQWSLDIKRIRIIRNPIDIEKFRPAPPGQRNKSGALLFAGHLQWFKGLSVLTEAIPRVLAAHPHAKFEFIGSDTRTAPGGGSMREMMKVSLGASGSLGNVSFLEPMPHDQLVLRFQDCAALVLPSFQEVYGNVVAEAMACGRPCVVTSTVGASELITPDRNGLVVPPDNPGTLAAAISRFLSMPEHAREDMGTLARLTVERVSAAPVIAAQTVAAYQDLLRTHRARSEAGAVK